MKSVYGVYQTREEITQAVQALKAKGYNAEDITIAAQDKKSLENTGWYQKEAVSTFVTEEDATWMDKFVEWFMDDNNDQVSDRLVHAGLSPEDAETYAVDLENGKVLVCTEEKLDEEIRPGTVPASSRVKEVKPGTAPISTKEAQRMEGRNSIAAGRTNNPDPNLFPETNDAQAGKPLPEERLPEEEELVTEKTIKEAGYGSGSRGRFFVEEDAGSEPDRRIFPPTKEDEQGADKPGGVRDRADIHQVSREHEDELVRGMDNLNTVGYAADNRSRFSVDSQEEADELNKPKKRDEEINHIGYKAISHHKDRKHEE